MEMSPVAKERNQESLMQTGQPPTQTSPHSLSIRDAVEALGMFSSALHRSINFLKDGGTPPDNTVIDFETGCFRKVGSKRG